MNYDVILFDLDGTMIDSADGIYHCVRHTLKTLNRPELSEADLLRFIGPPLEWGFEQVAGLSAAEAVTATDIYRDEYVKEGQYRATLYRGIKPLLNELKEAGVKLVMATHKALPYAESIADRLGILPCFDYITGPGKDHQPITKEQMIDNALAYLNYTDKSRVLFVGDGMYDAEGADLAHVDFALATYGFGYKSAEECPYPTVLAFDNADALRIFLFAKPYAVKDLLEISHNCMVCGIDNPHSLKARYYVLEDDRVLGVFHPTQNHVSYPGRMHGGVISTILDETIGRAMSPFDTENQAVTMSLEVKFLKPVPIWQEVKAISWAVRDSKLYFEGAGELLLADGTVAARGTGRYRKVKSTYIGGEAEEDELFVEKTADDPEFFNLL